MSTHNICFRGEIRKLSIPFLFIFFEKNVLSGEMVLYGTN